MSISTPNHPKSSHLFATSLSVSEAIQNINRHTVGKILRPLFKVTTALQVCLWKPSDTRFLFLWRSKKIKTYKKPISESITTAYSIALGFFL